MVVRDSGSMKSMVRPCQDAKTLELHGEAHRPMRIPMSQAVWDVVEDVGCSMGTRTRENRKMLGVPKHIFVSSCDSVSEGPATTCESAQTVWLSAQEKSSSRRKLHLYTCQFTYQVDEVNAFPC